MIAGQAEPAQGGKIVVGSTVRIGLVSQSRGELAGNERVLDVVGAGACWASFNWPVMRNARIPFFVRPH